MQFCCASMYIKSENVIYVQILNFNSKALEGVTDHAKTCIIDEAKVYMYIDPNSQQMCGVVYDVIRQVKGLIKEYQYFPFHRLSDNEKACVFRSIQTFLSLFLCVKSKPFEFFLFFLAEECKKFGSTCAWSGGKGEHI